MANRRIANYEIADKISKLEPFTNYNGTIVASIIKTPHGDLYNIIHWNTLVLTYAMDSQAIVSIYATFRSQTTSTLIGRILRNLPRQSVIDFLRIASTQIQPSDKQRLIKMAGLK
jgi:hypothetical protein